MSHMALVSPARMAAMMAAMMVAMMLPSIAPTLRRYHRALGATRVPRAGRWTAFFMLGYASVWTTIGVVLYVLSDAPVAPWLAGTVVLCAGILQRTPWKAARLARCREAFSSGCAMPREVMATLRAGCRLGIECGASCAALTAILFVVGLMDTRAMVVITAAITAERLAPAGAGIARLTGGLALCAGLVMCAHAIL